LSFLKASIFGRGSVEIGSPDGPSTNTSLQQGELKMIRFVRTSSVAPGKLGSAISFAKQITEYIAKQFDVKMQVMLPVGGNPHRIAWRSEFVSLGAMDEFQSRLLADPKYMEMLSKGSDNFIAGSINDDIWRTL
jgi:hypothetical protein